MNAQVEIILDLLRQVDEQRAQRAADPALAARVQAVKHYQHERFQHTYADLLAQPRYAQATRFFLEELYGPEDFTRRDTQFKRVVPGLVRLFPREVVLTVQTLGELHALSETLDTAMGRVVPPGPVDLAGYIAAWQAVGRPADREAQIVLMRRVADALDVYTRNPLLRHSLRLMRGPARLAGLPRAAGLPGGRLRHLPRDARCAGVSRYRGAARTRAGRLAVQRPGAACRRQPLPAAVADAQA